MAALRARARPVVLPRIGSRRDSRLPTLGGQLVEVMVGLGYEPHDWQRHGADVSLQLVRRPPVRGRGPRRLQARTVAVMVGRQSGKTAFAESRAIFQCLLPDLGVGDLVGAMGAQRVGWLAQDRASALRMWLEALDRLYASPFARLVAGKPRLQRGDESVKFTNGSSIRVVTPSRVGPRGLSLDCVVLDEALAHSSDLLAALAPTQAQRDGVAGSIGAQLVVTSSAPLDEYRSSLLVALREQGRRAVAERDGTRCWLEWSADPAGDIYDPAQWAIACPTLDRPGGITTDFLRSQAETLDRDTFAVEYLSLPALGPASRCVDVDAWAQAPQADFGDVVLAVDGRPDGAGAAIVAVGRAGDLFGVEVLEQRDGIDWLSGRLVELAVRWGACVVVDRGGPVAWLEPLLVQAGVSVVAVGGAQMLSAAAGFAVAVTGGLVAHDRDPRLDEAVEAAVRRRSGDRWAFDRACPTDLSPLIAASLGVWAFQADRVLTPSVY